MRARALSFGHDSSSITTISNCTRISVPCRKATSTATSFLSRNSRFFRLLCRKRNHEVSKGVRFDGPTIRIDDIVNSEDIDLVFENCVTRTLSPALTLEEGLDRIKAAVQMLRLDPPCCSSGFLRFQVAVPPSPKALSWFCCQPESSGVFPQIFFSKNADNPTCKSLHVNGHRGVFGIGAAAYFTHSNPQDTGKQSLFKRYISSDSTLIMAYGFMDVNFNEELISMSHEDGSFFFFIPQIELDEQETTSILISTLAWDDSSLSTFKEALHSLEVSLYQVACNICPTTDAWQSICTRSAFRKFNLVEDRSIPQVYMNTIAPGERGSMADIMELVSPFSRKSLHIPVNSVSGFHRPLLL